MRRHLPAHKSISPLTVLFLAPLMERHETFSEVYSLGDTIAFHYLIAYARKHLDDANAVEFHMASFGNPRELLAHVSRHQPDVVGFSCNVLTIRQNLLAAQLIKKSHPQIAIVLGGPSALDGARLLEQNHFVDLVFHDEAELSFTAYLQTLLSQEPHLDDVPGVAFRLGEEVRVTPARVVEDLSAIPSIYRDNVLKELADIVLVETSRGCSNGCRYCAWALRHRRYYPLDRMEDELARILAQPTVRKLLVIDSDFDEDPDRACEILRIFHRLNSRGAKLFCLLSFDRINADLLRLCRELDLPSGSVIGLQSTNRQALRTSGRSWFDIDQLEKHLPEILAHLPQDRLEVHLIYGLPGDTLDGFKDSLRWCYTHGFRRIHIFRLSVLPGTDFARNPTRYGLEYQEESPHLVVRSDTFSTEQVGQAATLVENHTVFSEFFGPEEYSRLLELGVDWVDQLQNLHQCSPHWETFFTRVGDSGIAGVKHGVVKAALDYLKHGIPATAHAFLRQRWHPFLPPGSDPGQE